MSKRKVQNRTEVLKGLSVPTLFKLAALQADAGHDGKFTIFSTVEGFKAAFGLGAPSEGETIPSHDTLKSALVYLLVESPAFTGDDAALVASRTR